MLPGFSKNSIKWSTSFFVIFISKIHLREIKKRQIRTTLSTPMDYIFQYFSENDFINMAEFTNIYAQQIEIINIIEINSSEIKTFIGIHLFIGVYELWSSTRSHVLATENKNKYYC